MPLVYRSMLPEVDASVPAIGSTANHLGVRVPGDISPAENSVSAGTGGMSVAPAWRRLPSHRIPKRLYAQAPDATGSDKCRCWRMGDGPFEPGAFATALNLRVDSSRHGLVEPNATMTLESYQAALSATQGSWVVDES